MGVLKTEGSTLKEYLERVKAEWVAEAVPLRLEVPEMSRPELRQDPGTREQ